MEFKIGDYIVLSDSYDGFMYKSEINRVQVIESISSCKYGYDIKSRFLDNNKSNSFVTDGPYAKYIQLATTSETYYSIY